MREQGEQALSEAQRLQLQSLEKSRVLEAEVAALRERERQFANVRFFSMATPLLVPASCRNYGVSAMLSGAVGFGPREEGTAAS